MTAATPQRVRLVRSEIPRVFAPLMQPSRYKGAYGGRGGAKSHFYAEKLILRCQEKTTRAVCIRETQNSIKDSVYQLLVDKILSLGVGDEFEILSNEIRGANGSLIIFKGMQSYNAETIKSLEAYDIAWVEEAQTLSQKSLSLLRPTIRKPDSEIWFSWNPRHRTDPVDIFFRKQPPTGAICVCTNWRDNPWIPDVLIEEMLHDKEIDPEMAEHVWEGGYGVDQGAILARLVDRADKEGRINEDVQYDPDGPAVDVSADIGFHDTAGWWFWQRRVGGYALLAYIGDSGLDAEEWIERLKCFYAEKDWPIGRIWLPHDARAKTFRSQYTVAHQFATAFGAGTIEIVPRTSKTDRINAARTVVRKCEFNRWACAEGLDGLLAWQYKFNEETQTFSKDPKHDWASHPGDAFSYGCQVLPEAVSVPAEVPPAKIVGEVLTLNDLWEEQERQAGLLEVI